MDDDESTLEITSDAIHHWRTGMEVISFDEPAQAWHELAQTPPDLFVTDFYHNAPSGAEMLKSLAERKAPFPVLIVSGFAEETCVRRSAGSDLRVSFVKKPWKHTQLFSELSRLLP